MQRIMRTVLGAAFLSLTFSAAAQKPAAYPSKGQSASQQSKDDGECLTWARNSVANNPAAQPAPPQQTGSGNERVQGAARGAVGGAAIGAIAGDAGTGAAVGAAAGTMAGGKRKRDNEAAQAQASNQAGNAAYNNAYAACMKGRGYTVN